MKDGILTNPWLVWGVFALALIGAGTVLYGLWLGARRLWRKAERRWVYPWMERRHEAVCPGINRTWRGRIVRNVRTGLVGWVRCVCVKPAFQYRDLYRPRWKAFVITMPAIARLMAYPPQDDGSGIPQLFLVVPPAGAVESWPLTDMTLAPSGEAAAFREAMEAQPEL